MLFYVTYALGYFPVMVSRDAYLMRFKYGCIPYNIYVRYDVM